MQEPQHVKDDVKDDGMSMPSGIEHNEETMQPHTTSDSAGIPGTSEVNAASPSNALDILTTSKVTPQGPGGGSQDEATSALLQDKEQVQAEKSNSEQASMNKQEGKPSPNEISSGQLPGLHDTQAVSQPQDSTAIKFSSPAEDGSNKSLPENAQHSTDDVQEVVGTESQYTGPNQLGMLERSASDTEICSSSNAVKGMDLDAVFSKSLECVAVPVRQNSLDNDLSKRPHHHRGTMMRSRTLSVVSLLSTRGTAKFHLSRSQKLTLFCLCLVNFTSYISYSVIAPFYPQEATFKGMREAVSGFVFSVYALTMMVFSPIFGKLVPILGAKLIFFSGILCAGGANILFGLLDMVEDTLMFTVLSFLVRILEALGAAGFSTASYSIVLHVYPDRISTVFGIIETAVGVGMSIGPAIGGALYSVGGFGLPFYILGSCVLLTFPICWFIMRDIQVQALETRKESYFTLLRIPQVIIVSIILVIGSQSQGFVEPTLEPHMRREFDVDTSIVGSFFLVMSAVFSICSPLVGFICMKTEQRIPIMIVGLIIMAAAQIFMGPAPFLGIPSNLWATLATVSILGASFAFAYVPTMESMIRAATSGGMEEDIGTYALVSGWWNSMYSLGEVIGPSIGGVLLDLIGFPWASTLVAAGSLLTAFIATLYWCCASRNEPESFWYDGQASSHGSSEDSSSVVSEPLGETTALLGKKKKDLHYNSL
ncbi:MFS-type transporter SLC18B1-like [Dermacentor albipictus]|uniref:MFS-type transporter SLC18B1-like n=1 Tax=Dermacentor albipictus TaxID=60249 RepID=UPI0031FBE48A